MQGIPIGNELGGYIVGALLGAGGMGAVYLGLKPGSNEKVAIKIMLAGMTSEPNARQRFEREIDMMRALNHPHIVPLYAQGEENGLRYLIMKLIMGTSLDSLLRKHQFSPLESWSILEPVAQALDYAHGKSMIHRDLKPGNILIESARNSDPLQGHVYLGDFGLSKIIGDLSLTPVGFAVGTAYYMSPEQILDLIVTSQSDIYSLGIIMYQVLCGRLPFQASDVTDVISQHIEEPPPPLMSQHPDFPVALNDVVLRALAKPPEARYKSAGDFASAYREALQAMDKKALTRVFWQSEV